MPQSPPPIYIHIGTQKTGSTSIQAHLWAHQKALKAQGVNYVQAGRKRAAHNQIAITERNGDIQPLLEKVVQEIDALPDHTHIISSEMFFRPSIAAALAAHLPEHQKQRVKLVTYLRRQDKFLEAMYKQTLKNGRFRGSPAKYAQQRQIASFYGTTLDAFAAAFGKEALIVRIFERSTLHNGDVVEDFAQSIGLHGTLCALPRQAQSNPTLSLEVSHLLGMLNRTTDINTKQLIREISRHQTKGATRSGDCYSIAERAEIMDLCAQDNAYVAKTYCDAPAALFEIDDLSPSTTVSGPSDTEKLSNLEDAIFAVFRAIGKTHSSQLK
ncbi:hypothetical protein [Shimia sp. MMG029]|uniref:hypothetical protein n=1 Tax=Shimia sp. MMG029 TaxID=3021978 RepID=UPI0022FF32AA|nr:hypothetical protein [Shimia sp. MMG029]MDA5558275.1 hypothetical protein [Shimia sp. MMG029]